MNRPDVRNGRSQCALYVGILTPGTTSRLRADRLRALVPEKAWDWVDTDGPMRESRRVFRTLAFRARFGPVVAAINARVETQTAGRWYDLVWVDKGVYLKPSLVRHLRERAERLVHFTPDTAFFENRSRHFERSIGLYDLLVTTKSFELEAYRKRVDPGRLILTTQGFDEHLHGPRHTPESKRREVVFVGLAERDRQHCVQVLLEAGVPVRLAGKGWGAFVGSWERHPMLHFEGESVFGAEYADMISRAWVGAGLVSKRFPELHTTRTFEIPACGTILATERNEETERFFSPSESLFYDDYHELAARVSDLFRDQSTDALAAIAEAGRARVLRDGRSYDAILRSILLHPMLTRVPP